MGRRDVPGEGKPFRRAGNTRTGYPSPHRPTLPKTFDWWGGCAVGVPLCGSIGKAGWVYVAAGRIYFNA